MVDVDGKVPFQFCVNVCCIAVVFVLSLLTVGFRLKLNLWVKVLLLKEQTIRPFLPDACTWPKTTE